MARNQTLLMGAVAYDPKVVTIWDGFKRYFADHVLDFDYVLYSNYERQVEAHLQGHVDVARNSPLAWLQTDRVASMLGRTASAICMRDADRDLTSVIVVKADSSIQRVEDVRGKRVGVGAHDSPQATLIPLHHLETAGLRPREDFEVVPFDVLVGKHGDHIGGERDAVNALKAGDVDAACLIDSNLLAFAQEGTLPSGTVPGTRANIGLRPLQLHGSRRCARGPGGAIPDVAARHVVCRPRSAAAVGSRGPQGLEARPNRGIPRAYGRYRFVRHDRHVRGDAERPMQTKLDTRNFM